MKFIEIYIENLTSTFHLSVKERMHTYVNIKM